MIKTKNFHSKCTNQRLMKILKLMNETHKSTLLLSGPFISFYCFVLFFGWAVSIFVWQNDPKWLLFKYISPKVNLLSQTHASGHISSRDYSLCLLTLWLTWNPFKMYGTKTNENTQMKRALSRRHIRTISTKDMWQVIQNVTAYIRRSAPIMFEAT